MFRHLKRPGRTLALVVCLMILAATLTVSRATAGGGPENVVVVVNAQSWASKAVANEFVRLRSIPPTNVVYLQDVPDFERVDVETFRSSVLKPVLKAVDDRRLTEQIDYVVYSSDLPWAIDARADLGGKTLPRIFTPVCSINGLTYLYQRVLANDPNYLQLNSNWYMRRPVLKVEMKPVSPEDTGKYREAEQLIREKKWKEAETILRAFVEKNPGQIPAHYNLACCLARLDKPDEALAELAKAVEAGWVNRKHAEKDEDLTALRERKEFQELMQKMDEKAKQLIEVKPTLAFHNSDQWNEKGEKVAEGGRRYLLSTMLAVTSGRGNSVREALDSLKTAVAADGSQPQGTIYYPVNGDIRSKTRDGVFPSAVTQLKRLGVEAEIVQGVLPQKKRNVAGAMIGAAGFDWKSSGSKILPGAICEHLTSFGGVMREKAGQTPLTEFIRYGAAGSSGTVTEPLAIQNKFPFAFLHVHYARGCSLAEAFYQSVFGPFQLLIVGDPLCQPWAKQTTVTVEGLQAGAEVKGVVTLTPGVRDVGEIAKAVKRFELFLDGRRAGTCSPAEKLTFDTTKLGDGHHEARVVAIGPEPIETQSRLVLPFVVNNHGWRVTLKATPGGEVPWDKPLKLDVQAVGATSIAVLHSSKRLANVEGTSGSVSVSPSELGQGPIRLYAVATVDGAPVRSAPVELTVIPPAALPAQKVAAEQKLEDGLVLTPADSEAVVVQETFKRNWLADLKLNTDQKFTMTGQFQVDADDVYQFQLRSNCRVAVKVDDQIITPSKPPEGGKVKWQFLPVPLRKGLHRLELSGSIAAKPVLDIRFGGRGAQSLDGKRFRHRAVANQ